MTKKNAIKHGDLVMIDGYIDRLFFVEGWQDVTYYYPDETFSETLYDVTCAYTGEAELAYIEDLAKVCDAEAADDYLLYQAPAPSKMPPPDMLIWGAEWNAENPNKTKEESVMERQPTARELSGIEAEKRKQARKERKEQIDNLLDIRNWNAERYEKTSERVYRMKVEEIDAELAKLAAEGRR